MTKMLVGRGCGAGPYPSAAEVARAQGLLSQFAFVGFTDDWAASVCRANSLFGRPTYEAATGDVRHGSYDHSGQDAEAARLALASLRGGFYDWADAQLFAFAVARFGSAAPTTGSLAPVES